MEHKFLEFMEKCGALLFGDFTLKSGRKSPYFINTGEYKTNRQIERLCEYYGVLIEDSEVEFDVLFGPAYKGIPLAVMAASNLEREVGVAFNRKEAKDHGDGKSIMGYVPSKTDRIAIIEDVTTAGTSIRETFEILKGIGIENPAKNVVALYISIDRQERGTENISATQQITRDYGIPVYSLATAQDIISYLEKKSKSEYAAKMRDYLKEYGV
ncbi:MAG: orotate phosphoribosyltransferase [Oscillospiraceae bacterium]|nr:orotate phosphoribosyltransferase [Oscillospiraceae bacterium]